MKGLGWPQQFRPGGAAGLGWPRRPQDVRVEDPVDGATTASGCVGRVARDIVVGALPQDSRHVIGAALSSAQVFTANGHRPAGSVMLGWDGAAPEVTDAGLAWPGLADVSRESSVAAPAVVRPRLPEDEPPSEGGAAPDPLTTDEPEDAVQAPGSDTSPPGAPRRLGHVSRETADDDGAGEPVDVDGTADARIDDSGDPRADDTRKSSGAEPTGQTAPVNADRQDQDGSRLMQHVSSRAGVGTQGWEPNAPAYGYDDHQRSNLVESLPRVDESTPLAFEVAEDARRRISLVGRSFPPPPHTRILTVANQKGGVGKTTTTVNVAAAMAQAGLNVIVLDIDPQGNASTALGIDHHADIPSLYDVVVEQRPLAQVLQSCPDIPNLLCAPATIDLAGAEIELVSLVAREVRLQKALRDYLDERRSEGLPRVDYVFIDCPPSLSLLTVNAFVAADEVFIPIQCEYYALEGLSQLLKHVELIRGHLNPTLHVSSILLTMYDGRTRLSSQVADEVRAHFPETVLKTTVPRSVRISEAPSHGQTVMTYDPASSGALSYLEAARELAEQVLGWAPASSEQEERA